MTPKGRARALQNGARQEDLAASAASCLLCGACEPACPEQLPLVDMVMELRGSELPMALVAAAEKADSLLVAGNLDGARKAKVLDLLGSDFSPVQDEGSDIALALQDGAPIESGRLERFLAPLRTARRVVVAEGILVRFLRRWLPEVPVSAVGEALLSSVEGKLRANDLYVIESRSYNLDQERLVGRYDALRRVTGCHTNLDLQRIAVPALGVEAQARWILEGRAIERIVVEDLADRAAFAFAGKPVLHVADLA